MAESTPVKYEDLTDELKKKHDEIKAVLEAELIGSFHKPAPMAWKGFSPEGALDGVDLSAPSEERTRSLRQEINYMVAHSLHRHSRARPILRCRLAWAAPEVPNSSAYVVYKIGGDPSDYQFLPEAPKEIPHGYACAYVPTAALGHSRTRLRQQGPLEQQEGRREQILRSKRVCHPGESSGFDTFSHHRGSDLYNLKDQFGMMPKGRRSLYQAVPQRVRIDPATTQISAPDFTKFSGSDGSSPIEHVSRYLAQLGTISASDELRVRFFAQSLTGCRVVHIAATELNPDLKQLEEQFHEQYHSEASEAGIADLAQVRQKRGETVSEYIQRFRTIRNRCYSVHVSEKEAVELAVVGLSSSIKDVASQADYPSLAHMVQKPSAYEQRHPDVYQTNSSVQWSWLRQTRMKVLREIER
ncbi:hypothetical protein QYE76_019092 [Lolium multiflorum]|uniref:Retrotransposon gag domain-containing protein n=1 Tax=Lolium multiflorum TaxID=4521 RepID=A0AAD8R294_LOLMU|nr:hypothetical protein QYE76_019092 [Lolium multiflorum]